MLESALRNPALVLTLMVLGLLIVLFGVHQGSRALRPLPVLILLSGWSVSAVLFLLGSRDQARVEASELSRLAGSAQAAIEQHLTTYVDGLRSAASYLVASPGVKRAGWTSFAHTLDLEGRYPGVNGIGVIYPVAPRDLEPFVRRIRSDGAPDFAIHQMPGVTPPASADQYVIAFIVPLDGNRAAVGLNVASEATRRRAAEEARDSGEPRLTGRIVLVQDGEKRPGFLLYLPVYRLGASLNTTAERRAAFQAWVYAPFVTHQFVASVVGDQNGELELELFEKGPLDVAHRLYSAGGDGTPVPTFALTGKLRLAGEEFTLGWNRGRGHAPARQGPLSWIGALFALVTALVAWLAHERMKSQESERRYRTLVEWVPEPLYVVRDGKLAYLNPAAVKLFGARSAHDVLAGLSKSPGRTSHELVRATWKAFTDDRGIADFETFWRQSVHDGVVAGTAFEPRSVTAAEAAEVRPESPGRGLELIFRLDPTIHDGRF
ncbi:MAG: CHASE domain-containing protein, partial [Gemmatimonadetes bacterium]|nr:CHASE domain-containing protein [Gemmatimonadota bacterium]